MEDKYWLSYAPNEDLNLPCLYKFHLSDKTQKYHYRFLPASFLSFTTFLLPAPLSSFPFP